MHPSTRPVRIGIILILLTIAGSLLGCGSDTATTDSGDTNRAEPSKQAVRAFIAEAKFHSCLPSDRRYGRGQAEAVRMTCPVCLHPEQRQDCINSPWTPERQRQYCEERLDPGNPHIDYCSTVVPEWAFPTLLLAKLPQLIEHICNDDAEHLRKRYDEVINAFYHAVKDRERAGLDPIYDEVLWPRTSEEIDC